MASAESISVAKRVAKWCNMCTESRGSQSYWCLVGNGWVAGMIITSVTSDEMDHSRKFPALNAPVSNAQISIISIIIVDLPIKNGDFP